MKTETINMLYDCVKIAKIMIETNGDSYVRVSDDGKLLRTPHGYEIPDLLLTHAEIIPGNTRMTSLQWDTYGSVVTIRELLSPMILDAIDYINRGA